MARRISIETRRELERRSPAWAGMASRCGERMGERTAAERDRSEARGLAGSHLEGLIIWGGLAAARRQN